MLCDSSVTAVGGERLPSPSINNAIVSSAFSHLLLFSIACLSSLPFASTMGKNNKRKREPTPPSEEFGDSEYSEEEFSPCVSRLTTQTTPRGSRRRSGRTSGPSSAPGSRARMSRSTPHMRRTRTAGARTRTRTTTTTTTMTKAVAVVTVTAAARVAAAAARTVTAAVAGAAAAAAAAAEATPGAAAAATATGAAAAAVATGPVARCHWSFRY
jgi:hypothetical protein